MESFLNQWVGIITVVVNLLIIFSKLWSGILGLKNFLAWVTAIIGTLLIPNGVIIWLTMFYAAQYLASITTDMTVFVSQVAWITAAAGSIYPLLWGIYIFPAFQDKFQDNPDNADSKERKR